MGGSKGLKEDQVVVCDNYGVGVVKSIYKDYLRGREEDYVHISYPKNSNLNRKLPLEKFKWRNIEKPSKIRSQFRLEISKSVEEFFKPNHNVQQLRINTMLNNGAIEDTIFILRCLDSKKRKSSLGGYDDELYKKILSNLSDELASGLDISREEGMQEIKKLLEKYKVEINIVNTYNNI